MTSPSLSRSSTTKRLGDDVGQAIRKHGSKAPAVQRHHHPLHYWHHHFLLQHCTTLPPSSLCSVLTASLEPFTTAANPHLTLTLTPDVSTRSDGDPKCGRRGASGTSIRLDPPTYSAPGSSSACQTTLTRGFVVPRLSVHVQQRPRSSFPPHTSHTIWKGTLLASNRGSSGELPYSTVQKLNSQYTGVAKYSRLPSRSCSQPKTNRTRPNPRSLR
jgi:hypothetical protein